MANRNRGDNLQHSDDEESQPQSDSTDTCSSENYETSDEKSVTEENDDMETENNSHEDIDETEDTAESVKNIPSFVKKQISKQPPKKMKKRDVASLMHRSIKQLERSAKERAIEQKKLEDPLYSFFLLMYQKTRKMPPASQHSVQTKIFETVSQNQASLLNTHSLQLKNLISKIHAAIRWCIKKFMVAYRTKWGK